MSVVKTISKSVESTLEPVEIFQAFMQSTDNQNLMLLESSEIDKRENVKSILMIQAAIRIECNENQVTLEALTSNGINALALIIESLKNTNTLKVQVLKSESIIIEFNNDTEITDEDSRLKQASPVEVLRIVKNVFKPSHNNQYSVFLTGLFSFDLIASFEKLPKVEAGLNTCPDYVFYLAESLLVIDHQRNIKRLYCNHFSGVNQENTFYEMSRSFEIYEKKIAEISPCTKQYKPTQNKNIDNQSKVSVDISNENYQRIVEQMKNSIIQGDIFQVVPSRSFSIACHSPIESYKTLKKTNPSPYMFFMQDQNFSLFGASPESALKYTKSSNQVELYPIAGTRARGKKADSLEIDLDLDARIETELKLDQKEVSEHMMLVDLARNDIAKISNPGTTHVPKLLAVDRYSQVMHLVSCVKGELRSDLDALHAYQSCMNMGTLTGAPKIKAAELIRQVEGKRRGSYGGAVGYLNGNGDMDTCIVIRSAFYKDGVAHVQAGAGIVYDSKPAMEALETENKAKAVLNAIISSNKSVYQEQVND